MQLHFSYPLSLRARVHWSTVFLYALVLRVTRENVAKLLASAAFPYNAGKVALATFDWDRSDVFPS